MAHVVKISSRAGIRKGRGFSLKELEKAGLTKAIAKKLKIPIDTRRKTAHDANIKELSKLKPPEPKKPAPKKKAPKVEKPKEETKKEKAKAVSSAEKIKAIEEEKERKIKEAIAKAKVEKKAKAPVKKPKKAAPKKPAKKKAAPKKK
jgi:hypothetical protein